MLANGVWEDSMILRIPLKQIPGQSFMIRLDKQDCSIRLTQRLGVTYSDLMLNNEYIWRGLICHDRSPILKHKSDKFQGNLVFIDFEGTSDPTYSRLDDRFGLFYITDDIALSDMFQVRGTERR